MRKLLALMLMVIFTCSVLSGCGPSDFQLSMYDAEDKVLMAADSYFYSKSVKKVDGDRYQADFTAFTGTDTLWDSLNDPAEGEVTIEGTASIDEGGFRLILVSDSGVEVFFDAEDGTEEFSLTKDLSAGRWRIKMLAKEASGNIDIILPGTPS